MIVSSRAALIAIFIDITRNSSELIEIEMNIFIFTLPNGESTLQCMFGKKIIEKEGMVGSSPKTLGTFFEHYTTTTKNSE